MTNTVGTSTSLNVITNIDMLIKVGQKNWIEKSFFEGVFKFGSLLGYQEIENEGSRDEFEGALSLTFALTNEETNIVGPDGKPLQPTLQPKFYQRVQS